MPAYVLASVPTPTPGLSAKLQRSEALGNQITELCGQSADIPEKYTLTVAD